MFVICPSELLVYIPDLFSLPPALAKQASSNYNSTGHGSEELAWYYKVSVRNYNSEFEFMGQEKVLSSFKKLVFGNRF